MKEKVINKRVGEQIRLIRLSKNLSQEALSEDLKISVSTLSNLERGETEFTITRLYQIMNTLKVDVLDFFILLHKKQDYNFNFRNTDDNKNQNMKKLEEEIRLIKIELDKLKNK